jgi:hypothetical protein
MGRAVVTERDVHEWRTRQQQKQEEIHRQAREEMEQAEIPRVDAARELEAMME